MQVIRLRKAGCTYDRIAAQTGLSRTGVFDICRRHEAAGAAALRDAPGGRKTGDGRLLDAAQEAGVRELIADRTPDRLQMPHALWTRAAVARLIEHRLGMRLPVRTMGLYLARWGFTPRQRVTSACEQSPAAVRQWLDEDYPVIAARARAEGAGIHWGDASGLRGDHGGRASGSRTPGRRGTGRRQGRSVISSVTNKGQMRWKIFDGALDAGILIDFFQRLVEGAARKVFLILDNRRVHRTRPVKTWLAEHRDAIEVFYLPRHSQELDPGDRANADLDQAVTAPARGLRERRASGRPGRARALVV